MHFFCWRRSRPISISYILSCGFIEIIWTPSLGAALLVFRTKMRIPVATEQFRCSTGVLGCCCHVISFHRSGAAQRLAPLIPKPNNLWKEGRADARLTIEHFCLSLTSQAQPATGERELRVAFFQRVEV
jgi:hypothetical protein